MRISKRDSCTTIREVLERNSGQSAEELKEPGPVPFIHNLNQAARLITREAASGSLIAVYADYDADGVCSAAIMWRLLTEGLRVPKEKLQIMFPGRATTGYGLREQTAAELCSKGIGLFVTVDNGVSAGKAIEIIKDDGAKTLILDHHPVSGDYPAAPDILVDPAADDGRSAYTHYCAAGLCYRLAEELGLGDLPGLVELAAVGTVADVVDLVGDNRRLVNCGIASINSETGAKCAGIWSLMSELRIPRLNAEDIGFRIGPCINAADRMGTGAKIPYQLLISEEPDDALARRVIGLNESRKALTEQAMAAAHKKIAEDCLYGDKPIMIAFDEKDNVAEGIVGIVAGRLAEELRTPAFVVTPSANGILKGSGRSFAGVNIRDMLMYAEPALAGWGGHSQAAGLTIEPENVDWARDLLKESMPEISGPGADEAFYDLEITAAQASAAIDELELFGPLGQGCAPPIFKMTGFRLVPKAGKFTTQIGTDGIRLNGASLSAVGFSQARIYEDAGEPRLVTLYGTLQRRWWKGCSGLRSDDQIEFFWLERQDTADQSPFRAALLAELAK